MYVCVCNAVTERHIEQAVQGGARRLRDLRESLGVAADCGRCASCAHECLKKAAPPACSPRRDTAYSPLYALAAEAT